MHTGFCWGNLRERDHFEDPGVDKRIILRWIFRKWDGGMDWTDVAQDRDRLRAFANEVNEPSGSIQCREFLDELRTGYLLKDFAPLSMYVCVCMRMCAYLFSENVQLTCTHTHNQNH